MNRRGFLKVIGIGAVGAVAAAKLPKAESVVEEAKKCLTYDKNDWYRHEAQDLPEGDFVRYASTFYEIGPIPNYICASTTRMPAHVTWAAGTNVASSYEIRILNGEY